MSEIYAYMHVFSVEYMCMHVKYSSYVISIVSKRVDDL